MSVKKKSSGVASTPDSEAGTNPLIPFVPKKLDNNDKPPMVEITILNDPDKAATKNNSKQNEFPAIETFTGSSATMVIVLKRLQTEVFEHLGISNNNDTKVAEQLDCLLQVTTGRARDHRVENNLEMCLMSPNQPRKPLQETRKSCSNGLQKVRKTRRASL
jgi:hypothetical protein